jgi:16S rRNA (cytidine1402-2'-O)-methyltransferase
VPGPSAVLSALVLSALPTDRFTFEGFLPRRSGARRARLSSLIEDPRTMVLFESPLRLRGSLRDVLEVLGDRRIAVARELTKRHEEVLRGHVSEVLARLGETDPKGEVALVIGGSSGAPADMEACVAEARDLVAGGSKRRDAARTVAERRGVPANRLYRALLD